jgi:hypothetical protein
MILKVAERCSRSLLSKLRSVSLCTVVKLVVHNKLAIHVIVVVVHLLTWTTAPTCSHGCSCTLGCRLYLGLEHIDFWVLVLEASIVAACSMWSSFPKQPTKNSGHKTRYTAAHSQTMHPRASHARTHARKHTTMHLTLSSSNVWPDVS